MINTHTIIDATQLHFESEFEKSKGDNSAHKISTTCVWLKHPEYKIHILSDADLDTAKITAIQNSISIDDTGEHKKFYLAEESSDSIRSGQYVITLQNNEEVITKVTTVEKETSTKEAALPAQGSRTSHNLDTVSNYTRSKTWIHGPISSRTRSKKRECKKDYVELVPNSKRLKVDRQLVRKLCLPAELQPVSEGWTQCQTSMSSDFWVPTKINLPKYPNSPLYTLTKNPLTEDQIKIIQDSIYVENGKAEAPENFTKLIPFKIFYSLNPAIAALPIQEIYKNCFMSWKKLVSDRIKEVQEPVSGALKTLLNNTELLISHKVPEKILTHEDILSKLQVTYQIVDAVRGSMAFRGPSPNDEIIRTSYKILRLHNIFEIFSQESGRCLSDILTPFCTNYRFVEICAGKGLLSSAIKSAGFMGQLQTTDLTPPKKEECFPDIDISPLDARLLPPENKLETIYLAAQLPVPLLPDILRSSRQLAILLIGGVSDSDIQDLLEQYRLFQITVKLDNYRVFWEAHRAIFLIKGPPDLYRSFLSLIPPTRVVSHGEITRSQDATHSLKGTKGKGQKKIS